MSIMKDPVIAYHEKRYREQSEEQLRAELLLWERRAKAIHHVLRERGCEPQKEQ